MRRSGASRRGSEPWPHAHSRASLSCLDQPPVRSKRTPVLAVLGTIGLHAALIGLGLVAGLGRDEENKVQAATAPPLELSVVTLPKPLPRAPEPSPPPEPTPEAPPPVAPPRAAARAPRSAPSPRPSEAAQAGKVLAAADEAVDFGDTIVSGKGATYAGGVTASAGTAQRAVHDPNAQAGGVPGGKGRDPQADASRAPRLAGGSSWSCPFPPEADDAGIDRAIVSLRVEVAADGGVIDVRASTDPGHGFAREARRCAQQKRWEPGLDRDGKPTRALALVNVRFER